MYRQLTVSELKEQLQNLENRGMGNCKVVLGDDEECNGYHGAYSGVFAGTDMIKDDSFNESGIEIYGVVTDNLEELVFIA